MENTSPQTAGSVHNFYQNLILYVCAVAGDESVYASFSVTSSATQSLAAQVCSLLEVDSVALIPGRFTAEDVRSRLQAAFDGTGANTSTSAADGMSALAVVGWETNERSAT